MTPQDTIKEVHALLRFHAELGVKNDHWEIGVDTYGQICAMYNITTPSIIDLLRGNEKTGGGRRGATLFGVRVVLKPERFGVNLVSVQEFCGS
jgi:hypothetical protein